MNWDSEYGLQSRRYVSGQLKSTGAKSMQETGKTCVAHASPIMYFDQWAINHQSHWATSFPCCSDSKSQSAACIYTRQARSKHPSANLIGSRAQLLNLYFSSERKSCLQTGSTRSHDALFHTASAPVAHPETTNSKNSQGACKKCDPPPHSECAGG